MGGTPEAGRAYENSMLEALAWNWADSPEGPRGEFAELVRSMGL